jgi:RNA polymerase sigma-70 factor (ECF subfamily)
MTPDQFDAFFKAEYLKLVKYLVLLDATIEEAEDAVQKAMEALLLRSQSPPASASGWVRRAAYRYFVKERQRDRERVPRELKGGHLVTGEYIDERLTSGEDLEDVEVVLRCLSDTQRRVLQLVMEGLSTHEIAMTLEKSEATIRQHLKRGRDHLKDQLSPTSDPQGKEDV